MRLKSPYCPVTTAQVRDSGLDYLALGHIHRTQLPKQVGKTWYGWPGVTMGRGFDECGVHGVFLTELDRNSCRTRLIPMPGPRYEKLTAVLGTSPKLPDDSNQVICRLTITGEGEPPDLQAIHSLLADRFLSLELRDETTLPQDLWARAEEDNLTGLFLREMRRRLDAADEAERANILLATRFGLAALEGGEDVCP
jgi:DNA repair exonuclease SbcCD nuclease subunit